MSTYSNRLQPALQNLLQRVVRFFHPRSSCTTYYVRGRFWQTKITRKTSDMAENLQLYRVVRFFHPRSSCMTTYMSADVQRITLMRHAWRSRVEEPNNSIYSAALVFIVCIRSFGCSS